MCRHRATRRCVPLLAAAIAMVSGSVSHAQRLAHPPVPAGTGFLLGQVVEADGHTPVSGAMVRLTVTVNPNNLAQEAFLAAGPLDAQTSRVVATTGTGYFLFRGLGKGTYSINVSAVGHLAGGYAQVKPGGAMRPIDLGENEPRSGIVITLWKYASITGTVTDDAGDPAAGALVTVFQRGAGINGTAISPRSAVFADDRGVYRFGNLAPGSYAVGLLTGSTTLPASIAETIEGAAANPTQAFNVSVRMFAEGALSPPETGSGIRIGDVVLQRLPDGGGSLPPSDDQGRMLTYAASFYARASTLRQATPIDLTPGEERTGIDLTLRLVAGMRVSGVATGPNGPMKGLVVHLASAADGPLTSEEPIGGANAFTDERGAFHFFGVAAGQYVIWAGRSPINPGDDHKDDWSWTLDSLVVANTDLTDVALTLRPGIKVAGREEFVGSKSRPEPNQTNGTQIGAISLRPAGASDFWRTGRTVPAPDGTFETPGDPAGRYFINVVEPPGWVLKSIMHDGRNVADEPIDLGPTDMTDLVVTLIDKTTHVRGAIRDSNGAPDTEADVIAFPADSNTWRDGVSSTRRVRLTPASTSGTYLFDGLPAGDYYLAAVDTRLTGNWRAPAFLDRLTTSATRITLADGEDKTVALKRALLRDK